MLDLSHIPNSQQDIQIFNANGSAWQTWRKPRKCGYVWIMCIGGAGGGGGGTGLTYDTVGSIGGGSGAVSRALYNANYIPDVLYVQVGLGGAGGAGATTSGGVGTSGGSGTRSWVGLQPAIVAQNIVQGSGSTAAAGGASTLSGGTAAGEGAMLVTSGNFLSLANWVATSGQTSPNPSINFDVTPLTSQITSAGAGSGGSILATSISPLIKTGNDGITADPGSNGIMSWKPFYSLGGASGGGGLLGFNGGKGGNGAIGSGGGGGGAATIATGSGLVAGAGGKGGDGLVIIISF